MLTELVHENQIAAISIKGFPNERLHPYIEQYPEKKQEYASVPIRFLPHVAFTIRFNLGAGFQLTNEQDSFLLNDHVLLPNNHTWTDDGHFFAIKFRYGLMPYLLHNAQQGLPEVP